MNTTIIYKDRIIGLLFLGAFLFYGIGRNLFESQNNSEQIIGSFFNYPKFNFCCIYWNILKRNII